MYLSVRFSVTFRGEGDELHQLHPRRLSANRCGATTIGRCLPYVTATTPGGLSAVPYLPAPTVLALSSGTAHNRPAVQRGWCRPRRSRGVIP